MTDSDQSTADRAPLIPDQRRELIVRHLRREGVMSYRQLTSLLGVSHMTIRRDIGALEASGRVLSTPGGAKLATRMLSEPSRTEKAEQDVAEKEAMAAAAAARVHDAMTVYLDAGTTMQAMRPYLEEVSGLTIVTNDLAIASSYVDHPDADVICVGGRLVKENLSTTGRLAALALRELSIDVAFLSASSWDLRHGVTTPTESKIDAKRAALESASESVLVTGSSKYGTFGRYRVFGLDEVGALITDTGLDDATLDAIRAVGIRTTTA